MDRPVRLVDVVLAGHRGDSATARRGMASPEPRVREVALGALARAGALDDATLEHALADPDPAVRRRACDLAASQPPRASIAEALRRALDDADPLVVEAACWALGELATADAIVDLSRTVRQHGDTRAREAAVAALGGIGDPRGLAAVLEALGDRPTVRRRAVVALAAFEGDEVADALRRSAGDRDWQVREVAEILLDAGADTGAGAEADADADADPGPPVER